MNTRTQSEASDLQNVQVLVRFSMRIILLAVFTAFIGIPFGRAMLWISVTMCVICGILKRERLSDATLNHWDEAAIYAALYCVAIIVHEATAA
jgi:hypothetical protein